ncbi:MAG: adenylate/guanylate cyclase domain-containing protein [SAR324 cluster bacterium]|nr:adenylate/guanylate cyclase domain-containing protein [SAR324 cluster bacterium]
MKLSIRFQIITLCIVLVLLAVVTVTWVSIARMTAQVDDSLYQTGQRVLENITQTRIKEFLEKAERMSVLLSRNNDMMEMLRENNATGLEQWLEMQSKTEIYALMEIFNKDRERLAKNRWLNKKDQDVEPFLTASDDTTLEKAKDYQISAELRAVVGGLLMKVYMPVVDPVNMNVLGVLIISFPMVNDWLDFIRGESEYQLTITNTKSPEIVTTFVTPEGLRMESLPEEVTQAIDLQNNGYLEKVSQFDQSYMVFFTPINDLRFVPRGHLVVWMSRELIEKTTREILTVLLFVAIAAIVICIILGLVVALGMTRPLMNLTNSVSDINFENLHMEEIDIKSPVKNELTILQDSFNMMRANLLRERDKMTVALNVFGKFVPRELLDKMTRGSMEQVEVGKMEFENFTLLSSEMYDFPRFQRLLSDKDLFQFMQNYTQEIAACIESYEGFGDKFSQGRFKAIFAHRDKQREVFHALHAAIMAQTTFKALSDKLAERFPDLNDPNFVVGIGIHTGTVYFGTLGSEFRMDLATMGNSVRISARLCHIARQYQCRIVASFETIQHLGENSPFKYRELDKIWIEEMGVPIQIYEIFDGDPLEIRELKEQMVDIFTDGIRHFRDQDWEAAFTCFQKCAEIYPQDHPTKLYLERLERFQSMELPTDWDGTVQGRVFRH